MGIFGRRRQNLPSESPSSPLWSPRPALGCSPGAAPPGLAPPTPSPCLDPRTPLERLGQRQLSSPSLSPAAPVGSAMFLAALASHPATWAFIRQMTTLNTCGLSSPHPQSGTAAPSAAITWLSPHSRPRRWSSSLPRSEEDPGLREAMSWTPVPPAAHAGATRQTQPD